MVNARTNVEKVRIRREIASIAGAAGRKKGELRNSARAIHAAEAAKPYEAMTPLQPAMPEHPVRAKRKLPVEEW